MNLKFYLSSLSAAQRKALASGCKTSVAYLSQIAHGHRKCSVPLAIAIERSTDGAVPVEELLPDLIEHWQYLRGTAKRKPQPEAVEP